MHKNYGTKSEKVTGKIQIDSKSVVFNVKQTNKQTNGHFSNHQSVNGTAAPSPSWNHKPSCSQTSK